MSEEIPRRRNRKPGRLQALAADGLEAIAILRQELEAQRLTLTAQAMEWRLAAGYWQRQAERLQQQLDAEIAERVRWQAAAQAHLGGKA